MENPKTANGANFMAYLDAKKSIPDMIEKYDYINCPIMGVTFDPVRAEGQKKLKAGEVLRLEYEPENPKDPFAIKVIGKDDVMLGYVPKELACHIPSETFYKVVVVAPYEPVQGSIKNWGATIRLVKVSFLQSIGKA